MTNSDTRIIRGVRNWRSGKLLTVIHNPCQLSFRTKVEKSLAPKIDIFLRTSRFAAKVASMLDKFEQQVSRTLDEIKSQGLYKTERIITSPQDAKIEIAGGKRVLNMCANNYLGLADHPALIAAAKEALDTHGFGMASVRFICGTQDIHKELEAALTKFLGTEDTILYPSCFDANGGLFETLLTEKDAVISDELNHASIIDGIRLCKAQRFRYKHNDMADLEAQLTAAKSARFRLIATDGCFSMDGTIANLNPIVPIMIGDAGKSQKFAARMLEKGVYVIGFFYPVVPHGTARVRTQVSAAHSREDLEFAVNAFAETNDELKQVK